MRQAGRYMSEYRALRAKYSILEMIRAPELACEVTLQPVDAFEVDAAIIFADILPLLDALGMELEFIKGKGPRLNNPITSPASIEQLPEIDAAQELHFTVDAIALTRKTLADRVPLLGFSGAPFTLACYAIQGSGSKTFEKPRQFMREHPKAWHTLLSKLSRAISGYLIAQIDAGAQGIQLFDSWAGNLTVEEYVEFVKPHSQYIFESLRGKNIPTIHFATKSAHLLEELAETGGSIISVDHTLHLPEAWSRIGEDRCIQGNLDPELLADGTSAEICDGARTILEDVNGRPGHIFNLGHGILKHTPVEHVQALVDYVHH